MSVHADLMARVIHIACPYCAAEPGETCRTLMRPTGDGRAYSSKPAVYPHASRQDAAREHCQAKYEPWVTRDRETHTCSRAAHLDGPHLCPTCGTEWDEALTTP